MKQDFIGFKYHGLKVSEVINILFTDNKHKIVFSSPCGYKYNKNELLENKEKLLDSKICEIVVRGENVIIYLRRSLLK